MSKTEKMFSFFIFLGTFVWSVCGYYYDEKTAFIKYESLQGALNED